jgi:hypothetical protein
VFSGDYPQGNPGILVGNNAVAPPSHQMVLTVKAPQLAAGVTFKNGQAASGWDYSAVLAGALRSTPVLTAEMLHLRSGSQEFLLENP